jgi:rhodanese-related sulfurtransferase
MPQKGKISPAKLIELLQENPEKIDLIDVRKGYEFRSLQLVKSHRISSSQITNYLMNANPKKIAILVSRDGEKSERIIESLGEPKSHIFNLEGGLDGVLEHPLGILTVKKPAYV